MAQVRERAGVHGAGGRDEVAVQDRLARQVLRDDVADVLQRVLGLDDDVERREVQVCGETRGVDERAEVERGLHAHQDVQADGLLAVVLLGADRAVGDALDGDARAGSRRGGANAGRGECGHRGGGGVGGFVGVSVGKVIRIPFKVGGVRWFVVIMDSRVTNASRPKSHRTTNTSRTGRDARVKGFRPVVFKGGSNRRRGGGQEEEQALGCGNDVVVPAGFVSGIRPAQVKCIIFTIPDIYTTEGQMTRSALISSYRFLFLTIHSLLFSQRGRQITDALDTDDRCPRQADLLAPRDANR